jgi:hypothetical protein
MADDPPKRPVFDHRARDERHWLELQSIFELGQYSFEETQVNFSAYVRRRDLATLISRYELFRQVIDLPGCIVELGVGKGGSLFTWTKLLETFCPNDRSRKVFGFDHFEGVVDFQAQDGKLVGGASHKVVGGFKTPAEPIRRLVDLHNDDNLLPGIERVRLVEGDVIDTLPNFLEENPGLKISLLHFDVDLYRPTKFALELLYPLVVSGGVVVLDEYGLIPWQGETKAIDEYFADRTDRPVIRKHPFVPTPHGYFIKK